jgi:hypothetical protein
LRLGISVAYHGTAYQRMGYRLASFTDKLVHDTDTASPTGMGSINTHEPRHYRRHTLITTTQHQPAVLSHSRSTSITADVNHAFSGSSTSAFHYRSSPIFPSPVMKALPRRCFFFFFPAMSFWTWVIPTIPLASVHSGLEEWDRVCPLVGWRRNR